MSNNNQKTPDLSQSDLDSLPEAERLRILAEQRQSEPGPVAQVGFDRLGGNPALMEAMEKQREMHERAMEQTESLHRDIFNNALELFDNDQFRTIHDLILPQTLSETERRALQETGAASPQAESEPSAVKEIMVQAGQEEGQSIMIISPKTSEYIKDAMADYREIKDRVLGDKIEHESKRLITEFEKLLADVKRFGREIAITTARIMAEKTSERMKKMKISLEVGKLMQARNESMSRLSMIADELRHFFVNEGVNLAQIPDLIERDLLRRKLQFGIIWQQVQAFAPEGSIVMQEMPAGMEDVQGVISPEILAEKHREKEAERLYSDIEAAVTLQRYGGDEILRETEGESILEKFKLTREQYLALFNSGRLEELSNKFGVYFTRSEDEEGNEVFGLMEAPEKQEFLRLIDKVSGFTRPEQRTIELSPGAVELVQRIMEDIKKRKAEPEAEGEPLQVTYFTDDEWRRVKESNFTVRRSPEGGMYLRKKFK